MDIKNRIFCFGTYQSNLSNLQKHSFYISKEKIKILIPKLNLGIWKEMLILQTCHRLEFYGISKENLTVEDCQREYIKIQNSNDFFLKKEKISVLSGSKVWEHMFSVVAGLDSMILGETQISSQMKQAISLASTAGGMGPILHKMTQESFRVAKKIRHETSLGKGILCLSRLTINIIRNIFSDLSEKNFLILGTGEISKKTALWISLEKPKKIVILGRDPEKTKEFCKKFSAIPASFSELEFFLKDSDVVIGATSAENCFITPSILEKIFPWRKNRLLLMLDLAIPPDIDADCRFHENTYLFGLEDIQYQANKNQELRLAAKKKSEVFLKLAGTRFENWLKKRPLNQDLALMSQYWNGIFSQEMKKSLKNNHLKFLSQKQKLLIESMLQAIRSKLTAELAKSRSKEFLKVLQKNSEESLKIQHPYFHREHDDHRLK